MITQLVSEFKEEKLIGVKTYIKELQDNKSLHEVIEVAVYSEKKTWKKDGHQLRLKNSVLLKMREKLFTRELDFTACITFEQVLKIVESEKIKGFGELAIYDTAYRIGVFLDIFPDQVYLHAAPRIAAGHLKIDKKLKSVPVERFPKAMQSLKPYEIEAFLCIYKKEISKLN